MTTAEHIAASKAAQEQEGFTRTPVTDTGERVADPRQTPLDDTSIPLEPEIGAIEDDGQPQRSGRERQQPIHMSPSDEMRANIAKRFRRDDDGRVPYNGDPNDPEMLYGKFGREEESEPEPEPAPRAEPQPQPTDKRFTIKVRGKDVHLTEAELLERASKVEAADTYLAESRDLLEQAKTIRQQNRERAPDGSHRPESRATTQDDLLDPDADIDPQHPEDPLEGAIEEVRYGADSKEAASKLRKAIAKEADQAADQRQIQRLIGQDNAKSTKAMKAFIDANPDLAQDERSARFMRDEIHDIQRRELIEAGIDESKLPKDNDTLARWHQFQRIHGSAVSSQEQLLDAAKVSLSSWRGGSPRQQQEQRKPGAPPRVEVNVNRDARRERLPNQPTRTMAPPPVRAQEQPAPRDRSAVIASMRKGRGQIVA